MGKTLKQIQQENQQNVVVDDITSQIIEDFKPVAQEIPVKLTRGITLYFRGIKKASEIDNQKKQAQTQLENIKQLGDKHNCFSLLLDGPEGDEYSTRAILLAHYFVRATKTEFIPKLDDNGEPIFDENDDPVGESVENPLDYVLSISKALQIANEAGAIFNGMYDSVTTQQVNVIAKVFRNDYESEGNA